MAVPAVLDAILEGARAALGPDFAAYHGHVHRVFTYARALAPADPAADEKLAIAAACHDLGIWTAASFDYLEPSAALARDWLAVHGRSEWTDEITRMIVLHHKLRALRTEGDGLVEAFRRADLVDLTWGAVRAGVPAPLLVATRRQWPSRGFHRRVLGLALAWMVRHPLRPLPMVRL